MIDFSLPEDLQMVQEMVRKFAAEVLRPKAREWETKRAVPDDLRKRFHELGVALCDVPEAAGGMGMGMLAAAVVHEELAFGDPGAAVALWAPHLAGAAIVELGTAEQQKRLLERFGAADTLGAVAWSERGTGLPEAGFATTAKKVGDGWILDGEKAFVVNGGTAAVLVVFAQVDAKKGWNGIGAFVVDGKQVTAGPRCEWLGLETVQAASLKLAGVRVAEADRLAGGDVLAGTRRMFARAAVMTAARQVGLARAAYEYALAYTQERVAFGKPVAHFQAISFTLAELAMEVDAARWLVWRAAVELDKGAADAAAWAAKASVQANATAWRVADDGVQLLGGAGYVKDHPVEKWLRDTKTLALLGPSDETQQLVVAGHALGKPEELGPGVPSPWLQPVVT
jgi:alkylation response protein AidB-like acyl-CoA dehydrogenase